MTRGDDQRQLLAKVRRVIVTLMALAAAIAVLGGCGTLANTTPDQVAIRYTGSDITYEAERFVRCYGPSDQAERGGLGDKVYYYPAGQRTFKFSSDPGADAPPLTVTAQGGISLTVAGTVTFTPNFTNPDGSLNCDNLKKFHEVIGRKFGAYLIADDESTEVNETLAGWREMLATYVKDPTDRAIDNASLGYDAFALSTDPASKTAWEQAAVKGIPEVMRQQSGGEFFRVDSVVLQAPQLPQAMVDGQIAKQTAQQQADAAAIAATAAGACNELCQEYQLNQALTKAINDGRVQVWPVPAGSPVVPPVPVR